MRILIQRFSGLFILLALSLFLTFSTEYFLTPGNLMNIVLQTSILAIVALGVGVTMLTAGIDLSVGSVAAFCGAVAAGLIIKSQLSLWLAIPAAVLAGMSLGLFNGLDGSGLVRVALIDPEGAIRIAPGTTQLVRLAGEYEIVSSLVAHTNHSVSRPRISNHGVGSLPTEFTLEQNYPNPFNPATRIDFYLPEASHVQVTVHNVLGQHVATLADGHFEDGTHGVTWDATGSSSGLYFYRVETVYGVVTGKMMLLK